MSGAPAARVSVVSGGARGIGRASALALARAGRAVAVCDLRADAARAVAQEVRAGGGSALGVAMDVTDGAAVRAAMGAVEAELGEVAILVNCAGWDEFRPFAATDEDFWRRVIAVNYEGALRTCQAALEGMARRGWGRIVNLSSDAGRVGSSQEAVYAGAKGAVIAFTKTIAREFARQGITANVVCPGPTDTDMLREMAAGTPDAGRLIAALERAVPMRRLGAPQDVAAAVAFLTSEEAGYITGQTLSVSGGLTMA
jgi:2-hydroxycyclohexanecarboxyl-CoA dehydrogenase